MPVILVNTPNLAADLVTIDGFITTIENNAPTVFSDIINACFKLKPTQDCDAMILHDFTDYQELEAVDLDNLTITFDYGIVTDCGCEWICEGLPFTPNSKYTLDQLQEDGIYCVNIHMSYDRDEGGPIVTYTSDFKVSYKKDCCEKSYEELGLNIWKNMVNISCCINNFAKIGRPIRDMKASYVKLSNLLWAYYNRFESCVERDKSFCLFNKIK